MSTEETEVEAEPTESVPEPTGARTSYRLVMPPGRGKVDRVVLAGSPADPDEYVDFPDGVGSLTEEEAQAVRDAGYELEDASAVEGEHEQTGGEEVK